MRRPAALNPAPALCSLRSQASYAFSASDIHADETYTLPVKIADTLIAERSAISHGPMAGLPLFIVRMPRLFRGWRSGNFAPDCGRSGHFAAEHDGRSGSARRPDGLPATMSLRAGLKIGARRSPATRHEPRPRRRRCRGDHHLRGYGRGGACEKKGPRAVSTEALRCNMRGTVRTGGWGA